MIMSDNDTIPKKSTSQINKAVFFTSALLIFLLVAFAAVFPDVADKNFKLLQQQIFTNASWFYILAVALILLSVTFLGLSRYGDIKLGPDHAQPDFSYHSWFAMLFSAGMGIGLMFFGRVGGLTLIFAALSSTQNSSARLPQCCPRSCGRMHRCST